MMEWKGSKTMFKNKYLSWTKDGLAYRDKPPWPRNRQNRVWKRNINYIKGLNVHTFQPQCWNVYENQEKVDKNGLERRQGRAKTYVGQKTFHGSSTQASRDSLQCLLKVCCPLLLPHLHRCFLGSPIPPHPEDWTIKTLGSGPDRKDYLDQE